MRDVAFIALSILALLKVGKTPIKWLKTKLESNPVTSGLLSLYLRSYAVAEKPENIGDLKLPAKKDQKLILGMQANGHFYLVVGNNRIDSKPFFFTGISNLEHNNSVFKRALRRNVQGVSNNGLYVTFELSEEQKELVASRSEMLDRKFLCSGFSLFGCASTTISQLQELGIRMRPDKHKLFDKLLPANTLKRILQEPDLFVDKYNNSIKHSIHYADKEVRKEFLLSRAKAMTIQTVGTLAAIGGGIYSVLETYLW